MSFPELAPFLLFLLAYTLISLSVILFIRRSTSNPSVLTNKEIAILLDAKQSNIHYWRVLIDAAEVMGERVKKYSGTNHPYFNFATLARKTNQSLRDVFHFYLSIKEARLEASDGKDFADESQYDTYLDRVNYTLLDAGRVRDNLTIEEIIGKLENEEDYAGKRITLDFDGVLNKFDGWTGEYEQYEPSKLAVYLLRKLRSMGYTIIVCTARPTDNLPSVWLWLEEHGMAKYIHKLTNIKEPTAMYVDDRAVLYNGNVDVLLSTIKSFKPHWETDGEE